MDFFYATTIASSRFYYNFHRFKIPRSQLYCQCYPNQLFFVWSLCSSYYHCICT